MRLCARSFRLLGLLVRIPMALIRGPEMYINYAGKTRCDEFPLGDEKETA